ncbi:MAG TPA: thermonuclease family protein, partial [Actinomycetota bacterium]|nr:thermonuclease family protein [Actinomycetota bacterium]
IRVAIDRPGGSVPVGRSHRIRILQIDTPETVRPNYPVQCAGRDATAFARAELPVGSTVYLLADREDKDRFGRYLRYLWDFEGEFSNEKAVARGLAKAVIYPPNDLYAGRMRQAEAAARQDRRGLWGEVCTGAQ